MNRLATLAFGWLLGTTGAHHAALRQEPVMETYAVVVNANNATKETGDTAKKTVKALFLKDLSRWADGSEAKPYGRDPKAPEHLAFLKEILGMSPAELARHWLKLKNMNGSTPPKEVDNDRLLLKHIARHDGAFGVVKAANAAAPGVRVLFEFKAAR